MNGSALTAGHALAEALGSGAATTTPTVISVVDPVAHAFADGDERALEAAYRAHSGIVYGMASRALPLADAEDVLQAVFVAAWRGRASFDPARGELRGWLVGITRYRIADALNARRRRGEVLVAQADESLLGAMDNQHDEHERATERLTVVGAVDQLGEPRRALVRLAFFEELTHRQISERTGLPLGTVKSHLRRALLHLATILGAAENEQAAVTTEEHRPVLEERA